VSLLRPSPDEERWLVVASRVRRERGAALLAAELGGDWRTVSLLVRCAFFVFGCFAAGAVASICAILHFPHALFVSGVVSVVAAEWLIRQRRLFASGLEEALEIAGLLLIVFDVLSRSGLWDGGKAALLIASAFAIAGVRLLNPLFTTLAAVALSFAVEFATGGHFFQQNDAATVLTCLLCFVVGVLALALGALQFQRPSHDRMLDWLVVAMPLTGWLWAAGDQIGSVPDPLRDHTPIHLFAPVALLAFGLLALVTGIRRRTHGPLLACMVCIACVAYELRNLTGLPVEARHIIWGTVALVAATILDRYLRTPRRGITSQKLSDREGPLDLLQLAGASVLTPRTQPAQTSAFHAGGGQGAGGGAHGTY
jgi:hypothetical protein